MAVKVTVTVMAGVMAVVMAVVVTVVVTVVLAVGVTVVVTVVLAVAMQLMVVVAEVLRRWQRNGDPHICPSGLKSSVAGPTGGQDALTHPRPAASCSFLENSCCPFQFLKCPFLLHTFLSV